MAYDSTANPEAQPDLSCPVTDDPEFVRRATAACDADLAGLDLSSLVLPGESVLLLGPGEEGIAKAVSRQTGSSGGVIIVESNEVVLRTFERIRTEGMELGAQRKIELRRGRLPDLKTNLAALADWLSAHPVRDLLALAALEDFRARQILGNPLVAGASIDSVISRDASGILSASDFRVLLAEILRVLSRGGRAIFQDFVADEDAPAASENEASADPAVAGILREDRYFAMLEEAGFHGIEILDWPERPTRTLRGSEYRMITLAAYKGKQGPCHEKNQAVIYKGPYRSVEDDDGHKYPRGERIAVCEKTFEILKRAPYAGQMIFISPRTPVADLVPFDCSRTSRRDPRETKGTMGIAAEENSSSCCGKDGCC